MHASEFQIERSCRENIARRCEQHSRTIKDRKSGLIRMLAQTPQHFRQGLPGTDHELLFDLRLKARRHTIVFS